MYGAGVTSRTSASAETPLYFLSASRPIMNYAFDQQNGRPNSKPTAESQSADLFYICT